MAKSGESVTLATVDPKHLEVAYIECGIMFQDILPNDPDNGRKILERLTSLFQSLDRGEIVDLFRRLCLVVDLIADIDEHWTDFGYSGERSNFPPFALFEMASFESACEDTREGRLSIFFQRDLLEDAFQMVRPN